MTPADELRRVSAAYWVSRALHVVAGLGVADEVGDTPAAVADVAPRVGAHPGTLARVLRTLGTFGIFDVRPDGTVAHTTMSRHLRRDDPESVRDVILMHATPMLWAAYGVLEHTVRTGEPAVRQVVPDGFFAELERNPVAGASFNAAMRAKSRTQIAVVLDAFDFDRFATIADIGGGIGHLLRAVLDATPTATGVLFDLPHVVAAADVGSDRLAVAGGDFFADDLPVCDAYLLSQVLHDWQDDEATAILRSIRRAAPPHARLLVIEMLIAADTAGASDSDWPTMLDLHMLTLFAGRERTRDEFDGLLRDAGFRLVDVIDTAADVHVLEAVPV